MAKVIIDFEQIRPFKDGDILIFDKKKNKFVLTTKDLYLRTLSNEINALQNAYKSDMADFKSKVELNIADILKSLETFKNGVNDKLKDYHEILQTLTKGE